MLSFDKLDHFPLIIGVVIPSYRVKKHILDVINKIGNEVDLIYVVDDFCPEGSGNFVEQLCTDSRVRIIYNQKNLGVGGAVIEGYLAAIKNGADIIVKVDGDGQMDPALIPLFISPIIKGHADYTKGNRFYNLESLRSMPKIRIFGNSILSLMAKLSTGYWSLFDPTNGYTAIHRNIVNYLPINKISKRYFFETDMLFRLYIQRAKVIDIPMDAKYSNEVSGLRIYRILGEFFLKHVKNFLKRIFYCYYLRDLSLASIELPIGIVLFSFGSIFGLWNWYTSFYDGIPASNGTIMLAALPMLMGLQLVLSFLAYDINSTPRDAIYPLLNEK
jgi:dolichol-phosphate mannosyltransferase